MTNEMAARRKTTSSRTRSIAYVGLTIALMAVGAWVTVPFGPIPFTLQTFVMVFALLALTPKQALASIAGYIVLGAIGVPVFSSMRGGIGVLAGPTGGFIWGFLVGGLVAVGFLLLVSRFSAKAADDAQAQGKRFSARELVIGFITALIFIVFTYLCGWVQLMVVSSMTPLQAFAVAIAPFIIVDAVKIVAAVFAALAVRHALGNVGLSR